MVISIFVYLSLLSPVLITFAYLFYTYKLPLVFPFLICLQFVYICLLCIIALNDLLNHVKDGHTDKIPDIMEQIMVASGELIASYDSGEMVRQARILAQSTTELIQAIKGEAETQSDSDLQVRFSGFFRFSGISGFPDF